MSGIDGIENLFPSNTEPYSVMASINDGGIDPSSSIVMGSGDSNLFSPKNELGKMDFLKLLITQLQYQDPLEPMESSEFVSQLAQFSALEGTSNIEQAISSLGQSYQDSLDVQTFSALSMTNASAVSMIGKEVRIGISTIKYSGIPGEESTVRVHLGNSDDATVQILDQDGEIIRTLSAENKDAENSATLTWDGKNDTGEYVQAGKYYLKVVGQENDSSLYCFIEDIVKGIRYAVDGPMVKIGGKELPIGDILDISMTESTGSNDSGLTTTTALSLLGKTVRYKKTELTYTPAEGQHVDIHADLGGFKSAIVEVKDVNGNVVYSLKIESDTGGTAHATLDCVDFNQSGPYTISLAGNTSAYLYSEGTVDGISTVDGVTKLRVNGITVSLSDIIDISSPTNIT